MSSLPDAEFQVIHQRIKKSDVSWLRDRLDAGLDPNSKNKFGWTLLMLAALEGRKDLLDLLIARGADAGAQNNFGFTAEVLAFSKAHRKAADFIAKHAADQMNNKPNQPPEPTLRSQKK